MPSGEIDESQPCECGPETAIRQQHPEHTVAAHGFYNIGAEEGWKLARQTVLEALPDQSDRITGVLG